MVFMYQAKSMPPKLIMQLDTLCWNEGKGFYSCGISIQGFIQQKIYTFSTVDLHLLKPIFIYDDRNGKAMQAGKTINLIIKLQKKRQLLIQFLLNIITSELIMKLMSKNRQKIKITQSKSFDSKYEQQSTNCSQASQNHTFLTQIKNQQKQGWLIFINQKFSQWPLWFISTPEKEQKQKNIYTQTNRKRAKNKELKRVNYLPWYLYNERGDLGIYYRYIHDKETDNTIFYPVKRQYAGQNHIEVNQIPEQKLIRGKFIFQIPTKQFKKLQIEEMKINRY